MYPNIYKGVHFFLVGLCIPFKYSSLTTMLGKVQCPGLNEVNEALGFCSGDEGWGVDQYSRPSLIAPSQIALPCQLQRASNNQKTLLHLFPPSQIAPPHKLHPKSADGWRAISEGLLYLMRWSFIGRPRAHKPWRSAARAALRGTQGSFALNYLKRTLDPLIDGSIGWFPIWIATNLQSERVSCP
jgi:hypothetical protein